MNEPPAQGPVDHAARPGAARGRVRPGARVHPGRAAARTGAEDLLPPRPRGDLGRDGDGAGGPREHLLPVLEGPPPRPLCRGVRGGGHGVRRDRAHHRSHLGEADLGDLVDVGRAAHVDPAAVLPLYRVPAAARRGARPRLGARYAAVLGICGMCLVPFIHLSVYLFRTLHPQPIILKPSAPSLPGSMLATWLFSLGVFTLLYVGFVTQRYALSLLWEERNGA